MRSLPATSTCDQLQESYCKPFTLEPYALSTQPHADATLENNQHNEISLCVMMATGKRGNDTAAEILFQLTQWHTYS